MGFCTACGDMLPAIAPLAPGATTAPGRPVGKAVAPWKVIVLVFVTLGVYLFVFWWRTSRETDAHTGSRSHPLVRIGAIASLIAFGIVIGGVIAYLAPYIQTAIDDPNAPVPSFDPRELFLTYPPLQVGVVASILASAILYAGLWRMWSAIRAEEIARSRRDPVHPGLYTGVLVAGLVVQFFPFSFVGLDVLSFVTSVAAFTVMASTQAHLNQLWTASGGSPPAAPPASSR